MSCEEMRFLVALNASNDITQEQKQTLDRHLTLCEDCRLEVRKFGEIQVPPHACAAVRARVLNNLRHDHRRWWISPAALVTAAACLLLLAIATQRNPTVPRLSSPKPVSVARAPEIPLPSPERHHGHRRAAPTHRPPPRPRATEPLVVKMFTDDPQVVIYWITEGNGE